MINPGSTYYHRVIASIACIVFIIASCQNEPVILPDPATNKHYPNVNPSLWLYFERFENEASSRGFEFDLVDLYLIGRIEDIEGEAVAGQCNFNHDQPNEIFIDKAFWQTASDRWREFVVFHELGHCVLLRGHKENVNPDGSCLSIMRSGSGFCWDNYNDSTRTLYLDELYFGQ